MLSARDSLNLRANLLGMYLASLRAVRAQFALPFKTGQVMAVGRVGKID